MAHPAGLLLRQAAEEGAAVTDHDQVGTAELAGFGAFDPAAEAVRHRLHAVTDAQDRNPEFGQAFREVRVRPDRGPKPGRPRARGPSGSARGSPRSRCVIGSSSAKTPHSRMRRAINCEYWPPKSRTSTSSVVATDISRRPLRHRPRRPPGRSSPCRPTVRSGVSCLRSSAPERPSLRPAGTSGCLRSHRWPSRSAARPSG